MIYNKKDNDYLFLVKYYTQKLILVNIKNKKPVENEFLKFTHCDALRRFE